MGRAGGAGPVAQAMAGPIFETFQDFSSDHMLVHAGNMRACSLQAKCRRSLAEPDSHTKSAGDARLM